MSLDRLASLFLRRSAQTAGGNATDLIGMELLVLDETAGRAWSRRGLSNCGFEKERLVVGPAGRDDRNGSASRGLVYGLPISLLLWTVIALGVWAMWLR